MRLAALLALLLSTAAGAQVGPVFKAGWALSAEPAKPTFWDVQNARLQAALARLKRQDPARHDVYILTVAAGGAQPLFDHEAKVARDVLSSYYGETGRAIVLSNRNPEADLPLATPANVAAAINGVSKLLDPAQDLLVVYLAAHGAPTAELETNLPGPLPLPSVDAAGLARALDRAGIKRRVILISACFAGSWIPKLASNSTIVVAAARPDRTSFGCDLESRITFFGHALLEESIRPGVPLASAFAAAKRAIAAREIAERMTPPSEPQASVGRDMAALWGAKSAVSGAARPRARPRP
ncbi:MAG TPA: C13 family peptidase [Sphingomonas sp.]|nr:C13 family peptidase [Sphingomonas sp.]